MSGGSSGRVAASECFLTDRGHGALHEPTRGLGRDAERLADLAVAALATVGETEALLHRGARAAAREARRDRGP